MPPNILQPAMERIQILVILIWCKISSDFSNKKVFYRKILMFHSIYSKNP